MQPDLTQHPDRLKWNEKHRQAAEKITLPPAPLLGLLQGLPLPPGPVLELACGISGSTLALAKQGRDVVAIDISDTALAALRQEAADRKLDDRISLIQADLSSWTPGSTRFALVFCFRYWDKSVFQRACEAVMSGGLLLWGTFTSDHLRDHPSFRSEWCLQPGEPENLLPGDFTFLQNQDRKNDRTATRLLIARRQ